MAIMSLHNWLRIPPIIIMDELFKTIFGSPNLADAVFPANNDFVSSTLSEIEIHDSSQFYKAIFLSFIKIIVSFLIFCSWSSLFVLPVKYICLVYFHILSVCIVLLSISANIETLIVVRELQVEHVLYLLFRNLILQCFLSLLFNILQNFSSNQPIHKAFSFTFSIPTITIAVLPGTWLNELLNTITVFSTLWPLLIMMKTFLLNLFTITNLIRNKYSRIRVTINFRINNLVLNVVEVLEVEWNHLNISCVLRMFWVLRILEQVLYLLINKEIQNATFFGVVKNVSIKGCDTFTAVLGMTNFLSYFCNCIGASIQLVLFKDDGVDKRIRTTSAVLLYILALQTGPTGLEEHIISLYRNICLFCAIILHHIHYSVNPSLLSLSVSYNLSYIKHIRTLLVCGLLIVIHILILTLLWSHNSGSAWLLAVSIFNIQIIIRLLESLAVYSLFLLDARRTTFWRKLDDYVYYIKLFGNTMEFYLGIFHFLYGLYIMAFVSGGAVHTSMMFIHAYFNIWCDARDGWRVFIKHRTAVKKIESLPAATRVQLSNFEGACAICYRNMGSAKITKCNHYFHGVCLRKWLYFKDRCPLCRDILYKAETSNVKNKRNKRLSRSSKFY